MLDIKRRTLIFTFSFACFLCAMFYYYQNKPVLHLIVVNNETKKTAVTSNNYQPMDNLKSKNLKKIFLWNSPHRIEVYAFGTGHQPFIDSGCSVSNCFIQTNSSDFWSRATANNSGILKNFDAVLVNIHELWLSFLPDYERPAGQRLVWLTQESPQTTNGFVNLSSSKFDGIFNWTMTYKRDSDIQLLYGRVERIKNQ